MGGASRVCGGRAGDIQESLAGSVRQMGLMGGGGSGEPGELGSPVVGFLGSTGVFRDRGANRVHGVRWG